MIILDTSLELHTSGIAYFKDISGQTSGNGYGQDGNIDYADVVAVRIKTGTYSTVEFPSAPSADTFTQYTEYLKIAGDAETIDGKTFTTGMVFVPQSDGLTTTDGENWQTTGYYVWPFLDTWLPTQAETPLDISVEQFGQSGEEIYDNVYPYAYEIYYDEKTTDFAAVAGATYMVVADDAQYLGDTYYAGEIFTASDTSTVSVTSSVARLYGATSAYTVLVPVILADINDVIERQIGLNNQDLIEPTEGKILKIRLKLEALQYASQTQDVSLLYAYQTIQTIQETLNAI